MKIKNLLPIIAVAAITQGAFAAEIDAVTLSHDGRILRAQGAPAAVQVAAFSSTAPDSVPATCKAFDMAGFLNRDDAKPLYLWSRGFPMALVSFLPGTKRPALSAARRIPCFSA